MAINRVPPAGAPTSTTAGVHSSEVPVFTRSPIGTEGVAGLYTGQVAVPRGTAPAPAPEWAVEMAASQRADRFGLGQEAVPALVQYFRESGSESFPELTNLRSDGTIGGGSYESAAASRAPLPPAGIGAVGSWFQNTNILIALAAGGLALYLLTRKGKR